VTEPVAPDGSKQLLITIDEAARRLAIGRSHIYRQMQLGHLRSIRIGRSRRILESDLDAFVADLLDSPDRGSIYREAPRPKALVKRVPLRRGRR
jgi:excisionase family DNA binding protein